MKARRLLWHLVKFQFLAAPTAFWVILGMLVMMVDAFVYGSVLMNPPRQISVPIFWGDWLLIYLPIQFARGKYRMGPERLLLSDGMPGSGDFLWTRAVDRRLVFWSKLVMFSMTVLVLWGTVYVVVPVLLWLANVPIAMPQFLVEAGWKGVRLLTLGFLCIWLSHALERFSLRDLPGMLLIIAGALGFMVLQSWWHSSLLLLLAAGLAIAWSIWSATKRYVQPE